MYVLFITCVTHENYIESAKVCASTIPANITTIAIGGDLGACKRLTLKPKRLWIIQDNVLQGNPVFTTKHAPPTFPQPTIQ